MQEAIESGNQFKAQNLLSNALQSDSLFTTRQYISEYLTAVAALCDNAIELKKSLLKYLLDQLLPRAISFEEQIANCLEILAKAYEVTEEWHEAAKCLMQITMESSQRNISPHYKVSVYIRIVRLLLEDDGDFVQADAYLNRASLILPSVEDEALLLQFRVCQARILDLKRKFNEAAIKYYELSKIVPDETEQIHSLTQAIICAVLCNPGQARTRILLSLYTDMRVAQFCALPVSNMLECVFKMKLITSEQKKSFQGLLSVHHMATLSDGSTVFDRSVLEHNILAISKLFISISFARLGEFLDIPPEKAEQLTAKMFTEERIQGHIDQIDQFIYFKDDECISTNEKYLEYLLKQLIDLDNE